MRHARGDKTGGDSATVSHHGSVTLAAARWSELETADTRQTPNCAPATLRLHVSSASVTVQLVGGAAEEQGIRFFPPRAPQKDFLSSEFFFFPGGNRLSVDLTHRMFCH